MAETELTVKETRHCVDILTDCSAKQHSQLEKEGQRACPQLGFPDQGWMAEKAELETSRAACRVELDKMPDFTTEGNQLRFSRAFVELPAAESYCDAPREVVDAARSLLDADLVDTVAKVVHDAVTIGSRNIVICPFVPEFLFLPLNRSFLNLRSLLVRGLPFRNPSVCSVFLWIMVI